MEKIKTTIMNVLNINLMFSVIGELVNINQRQIFK